MLGAITGDFIGSFYEWNNVKTKNFPLIVVSPAGEMFNHFTDDSVMTLAVGEILKEFLENEKKIDSAEIVRIMQKWGRKYPNAGYGGTFIRWLSVENPKPYGSWGNGVLMRISPVGLCNKLALEEKIMLSEQITCVSHNAKEAVESVKCYITILDLLCSSVCNAESIKQKIISVCKEYNMNIPNLNEIRPKYKFDVSCKGTLPVSVAAFLESEDFEDAIRNAISVGGDSDTIAAITGGMAEAFYGKEKIIEFLEKPLNFEKDLGVLGEDVSLPLGEGEVENRRFETRGRLSPLALMKKSDAEFVKTAEEIDKVILG